MSNGIQELITEAIQERRDRTARAAALALQAADAFAGLSAQYPAAGEYATNPLRVQLEKLAKESRDLWRAAEEAVEL